MKEGRACVERKGEQWRRRGRLISATSGHRPDLGVARILPTLVLVLILNCSRCVITLATFGGSTDSGLVISGHIWEL